MLVNDPPMTDILTAFHTVLPLLLPLFSDLILQLSRGQQDLLESLGLVFTRLEEHALEHGLLDEIRESALLLVVVEDTFFEV